MEEIYYRIVFTLIFIAAAPVGASTKALGLFGSLHQHNNNLPSERKIVWSKYDFRHSPFSLLPERYK